MTCLDCHASGNDSTLTMQVQSLAIELAPTDDVCADECRAHGCWRKRRAHDRALVASFVERGPGLDRAWENTEGNHDQAKNGGSGRAGAFGCETEDRILRRR